MNRPLNEYSNIELLAYVQRWEKDFVDDMNSMVGLPVTTYSPISDVRFLMGVLAELSRRVLLTKEQ